MMILYEVLAVMSYICVGILCFWAGAMWKEDREKERLSARVIRPAVIVTKPQYKVTEYIVSDNKALDLDFPPVTKV